MPVTPIRSGTIIRFVGESVPRTEPSLAGIVAVPIVHDWGPDGATTSTVLDVPITSILEFDALYGNTDTAGRRAVIGALNGQGLGGGSGAGGVLVYRMQTGTAAAATKSIQNTTPAAALTLTAKYKGTRGNIIGYTNITDPRNALNAIFALYVNGQEMERFNYVRTDVAGLASSINLTSKLTTATAVINGVALGVQATVSAFTGGVDGNTLTGTEYASTLAALEFARFSVIAFYNLTDATILQSLKSWVQAMDFANRPVVAVVGGDSADTISTAITRSAALADPHIVNLGVGVYNDDLLDRDLSTAELAPRIAGVLAARGEERSLTFAKVAGLTVVGTTGPDSGQIESAIVNGVTVLSRATSPDATLKIEKGVTTFISRSDAARPYAVFSDPRLVRIMDLFVRDVKEWADENIIGDTTVNQDTRDAVGAYAAGKIDNYLLRGLVLPEDKLLGIPKPFVSVVVTTDDTIPFDFGFQFARTTNFVLGNGRVR